MPLIQGGVEEALHAGMDHIVFVKGCSKRAIADHFDITDRSEDQINGTPGEQRLSDVRELIDRCTFTYIRQIQIKGLSHAILSGEILVGNEPFGVVLADSLCITESNGAMAQISWLSLPTTPIKHYHTANRSQ